MSDPKRLLDRGTDPLSAKLLRSGLRDAPDARSRGKAIAALGLAAASGTVAGSAAATVSSKALPAAWLVLLKWFGLGVIGGAVTIGAVRLSSPEPTAPAQAPVAPTQVAAVQPSAPSRIPIVSSAETAPPPPSAPPVVASTPQTPRTLAEEVASLDAARKLLSAGDPSGALAALDRHRRDFPGGALGPEAMLVRLEALMAAGRQEEARALGQRFLDAHPDSPLQGRVRTLIGATSIP